tara:strand:+ start:1278 stop:2249 length:972 start_codon:yes stop_codon:yes gene_type:complete
MAFHESAIFPTDISYGSTGGAGYNTAITKLDSGQEIRGVRWEQPMHQYDASYGIKTLAELREVLEFYHARKGSAHGFRWKDPMDFSTDSTRRGTAVWNDESLGVKNSSNQVQLKSLYTSGGVSTTRNITKPISGTVKVGWNGAEKDGSSSGEVWSVDTATGIITASDAGSYAISAGCQFHVPCRFGEEIDAHMPLSFDAFEMGSISQIPVVEIKSALENTEAYDFGGSTTYLATSADAQYSHGLADGRVAYCKATSSYVITLILPTITSNMPTGNPYFYIINQGGGGNVVVKEGSSTLITLADDRGAIIGVHIDGSTRKYFIT